MAFLDRIFRDQPDATLRRSNHLIAAGMWVVARGEFTLAQFKAGLGLVASDNAQLDQLVAFYLALLPTDQARFFNDWSAWTILAEKGLVSRSAFAARFGMTE